MFKHRDRFPHFLQLTAIALLVTACGNDVTAPVTRNIDSPSLITAVSTPSLLIDTGPGASVVGFGLSGGSAEFPTWQFLGGQFNLADEASISSVAGWMKVFLGGDINVHIRANTSGLPGASIYSQVYTLAVQDFDWSEFSNFNVNLGPGTYWLTFEPVVLGGLIASMPNGAASPLANYAFKFNFAPTVWSQNFGSTTPAMGFRVSGLEVTPESMISDLRAYVAGAGLPTGSVASIESKLQNAIAALDANQPAAACGYLQDLLNYTIAQTGKKIPVNVASEITSQTVATRTRIGC